jgi:UMP-CMP kinase
VQNAKFLVDGFPRNQDNVDGWERVVGEEADVKGILYFNCTEVS